MQGLYVRILKRYHEACETESIVASRVNRVILAVTGDALIRVCHLIAPDGRNIIDQGWTSRKEPPFVFASKVFSIQRGATAKLFIEVCAFDRSHFPR